MSRLSKTARAAIAALVVSGAAAVAPLLGPSAAGGSGGGDRPSPSAGASSSDSGTTGTSPPAGEAARSTDEASGLPPTGPGTTAAARRAVLFVGDVPALRPRGGSAASFVCRAAALMERRCTVAARVPTAATAAKVRPDVVVLVMAPTDDAHSLTAELDALPASLRGARTAVLAPVVATRSQAAATTLAAVRTLAAARGVDVVDPVDLHWVTATTRTAYLGADGRQPTAAGVAHLGERLALALTALGA